MSDEKFKTLAGLIVVIAAMLTILAFRYMSLHPCPASQQSAIEQLGKQTLKRWSRM